MAVRADDVDLTRDRSLVELCQAGDQRAFSDLYSRYYQRLLRFCMRRVGNAHEAEEITQEAFARAFSAMPRFAGERRFYPWLTVIASRLCVDSHRRGARAEPTAEIDPGSVEGGQQQIIDNVDLDYLAKAMEQLGPRHREVLELRENQGWSYQQIADHYSVTMGTVEALLFRARKALKREFLLLAGPEARLAGLPFIGAMYRAAAHLRARISDLGLQLAPAAAAGMISVAAVAGGIAGSSGGAVTTRPAPTHAVAGVVSRPLHSVSDVTNPSGVQPSVARVNREVQAATQTRGVDFNGAAGAPSSGGERTGVSVPGLADFSTTAADIDELVANPPGQP